jgi:G:T-mismatch repair DNA endonuclease (very short patch repair protein)
MKDKKDSLNKIEQKVFDLLKKLRVQFQTQVKIDKYNVDFLVNDTYIIECYGDFWHCNPQKYKPDYFNRGKKKTAREIWERDLERKKRFEELGYKFINLWECDIRDNTKKIKTKLKRYLNRGGYD